MTIETWYVPGIYKCTNVITEHVYIGSSVKSCGNRKFDHISKLRNNRHSNSHFQNAWNKYGEESFVWEMLEVLPTATKDFIREKEQQYINSQNPKLLYNIKFTVQPYSEKSEQGINNIKAGNRRKRKRMFEYIYGAYSPNDVLVDSWYYSTLGYINRINELKLNVLIEKAKPILTYMDGVYPDDDEEYIIDRITR